jgi:hypothetical protein
VNVNFEIRLEAAFDARGDKSPTLNESSCDSGRSRKDE